jgi:dihydroorotate dehydrogenase electron transfer subunit
MFTTARIINTININEKFRKTRLKLSSDLGDASPFQFIMIGLPSEFEIPLSISQYNREELSLELFYKIRGSDTEKLSSHKGYVTIRGFYGKNKLGSLKGKRILYITEDMGFSILPILQSSVKKDRGSLDVVMIFEEKNDLFNGMELIGKDFRGLLVTLTKNDLRDESARLEYVIQSFNKSDWDLIIGAGRRSLLKTVYDLSNKYKVECFIAPYTNVKCGIGACGYCTIPRTPYLLCVDGPLFKCEELAPFLGVELWKSIYPLK